MTPTQRTLARMRNDGYLAAVVEKWIPAKGGGFRLDLFGVADVEGKAIPGRQRPGTLYVQSCGDSWSAHVKKLQTKAEVVAVMIYNGDRIELWSWVLRKPRGERARCVRRRGIVYIQEGRVHVAEIPDSGLEPLRIAE